jgi:TetR/AcrR family fatty acid metabolism transcriptional regulator
MPTNATAKNNDSSRELKRQRIMRAAIEVFARNGYFAARMTDVAQAAEVADGTLYLYFEGKEDLLISIFDDIFTRFTDRVRNEIELVSDPIEKLRTVVRLHLEALGQDRALAQFLQIETRHSRRFMNLFTRGRLGDYLGLVRSVIEDGQKSGAFRTDISPGLGIIYVFGAVDEAVTSWLLEDEPRDLARRVEPLVSLLCSGIVQEPIT